MTHESHRAPAEPVRAAVTVVLKPHRSSADHPSAHKPNPPTSKE